MRRNKLQAINTAHEGYGHAYLYELTKDPSKSSHTYKSEGRVEWDEELKMNVAVSVKVPTNSILERLIKIVEQQAKQNYEASH